MSTSKQHRRFSLILAIGAVFLFATTAYAENIPKQEVKVVETGTKSLTKTNSQLSVDDVRLSGDTLHISVSNSGESQELELNLRDYAKPGDEYVSVQATDKSGNTSNTIQFKNPYYVKQGDTTYDKSNTATESAIPGKPFTPDGTGTVIDNSKENSKEFFTVETADGNMFYLIVDRERTSENVYLLNAVSENDLASLAKPDSKSAIPETLEISEPEPEVVPDTETPVAPENEKQSTNTIIFVVIACVFVGGAGYYFKIVRPKKNDNYYDESDEDESDEESEEDDI